MIIMGPPQRGAAMLWRLRLIGVGSGFDGIDGNYWQREQFAGARCRHACRWRAGHSSALRPLDCSIRMIFCAVSICLTFSRTTSPARSPQP
jgi:hypothetical protein